MVHTPPISSGTSGSLRENVHARNLSELVAILRSKIAARHAAWSVATFFTGRESGLGKLLTRFCKCFLRKAVCRPCSLTGRMGMNHAIQSNSLPNEEPQGLPCGSS
jgi:hypothetical protein